MSAPDLFPSAPLGTFMGLPAAPRVGAAPPLACIVGIPFDCGTHAFRIGSREGPDAIRKQSHLLRAYDVDPLGGISNPTAFLRMIDAGNAPCAPGNIDESYPAIEGAIASVLAAGAIPISMGGDGAGTLPQLRAVAKRYPDLAVLHIDAHTDTYDLAGYNTATTFTRAAEEHLVDVQRSFHVGARGNTFVDGVRSATT
jgi:agmatinase